MKIKRGRLQQIIQEELKRVLKEELDEPYMVVARDSSGEMVFHDASGRPNNLTPKIYDNEKDAVQFSINQTSKTKTAGSPPLYAAPVSKVLDQIAKEDHPQYNVVVTARDMHLKKRAASDSDPDIDNDGRLGPEELRRLADKLDFDLDDFPWGMSDDPEISGVIAVATEIAAATEEGATLSGEIVDENTVDARGLDALAKAFKPSKTINHDTEDASGTIEIGKINGKDIAAWKVMGHTTWIR